MIILPKMSNRIEYNEEFKTNPEFFLFVCLFNSFFGQNHSLLSLMVQFRSLFCGPYFTVRPAKFESFILMQHLPFPCAQLASEI